MLEQAILLGLAGWRLASLLVNEDGPGQIFERLRDRIGLKPGMQVTGFFPLLFSCMWCMTIWTTVSMYIIWRIEPTAVIIVAAMTVAMIPEAIHGYRSDAH